MKNYFLLITFSLTIIFVYGQKKASAWRFRSVNSVALVNGSNSVSATLQSVNGLSKGSWFAGIGAGLDYYLYRTVPVFADLRYELGKRNNKFFVYADGGISIDWVQDYFAIHPVLWTDNMSNQFHSGPYTDAGFGYVIGMKKKNAIILSLGHSFKKLRETFTYQDWRTGEWQTDENIYRMNRMMLKAGWRF